MSKPITECDSLAAQILINHLNAQMDNKAAHNVPGLVDLDLFNF